MTELLKQYYETQKRFRTKECRERYADVEDWSYALNCALGKLLSKMSKDELQTLLDKTSGMYRLFIAEYLKKCDEPKTHKKKGAAKNLNSKTAADNEMAATKKPLVAHA